MMARIILITFLLFLYSPALGTSQEEDQQFEGFNLHGYTEGGELAWDVTGDTADIRGDVIDITNVDGNRYGKQEMNLKARKGRLDKVSGNIHLEGDVVITAKSTGGQLQTDTLDWDKENDLVSTDDYVVIIDERMVATGTGMRARPGLKIVALQKDVTVKAKTDVPEGTASETEDAKTDDSKPEAGVVTITCAGAMEIDHAKSMAVFNRDVVAVHGNRTLNADKMDIFFDPESSQIDKVICTGNVKILRQGSITRAEKAVYIAKNQRVILIGRPKLVMDIDGDGKMGAFK